MPRVKPSLNSDWDLNPRSFNQNHSPGVWTFEGQVPCVSVQKEFNERQSGKQDVVILIEDACERCKQAGKGALLQD